MRRHDVGIGVFQRQIKCHLGEKAALDVVFEEFHKEMNIPEDGESRNRYMSSRRRACGFDGKYVKSAVVFFMEREVYFVRDKSEKGNS